MMTPTQINVPKKKKKRRDKITYKLVLKVYILIILVFMVNIENIFTTLVLLHH